jgi:toxin ParE1/3/4
MPQCIILPSAERDLDDIWDFIARDSPLNADRFVDRIYELCRETLAYQPLMGRPRDELSPGIRSFAWRRYLIFYRPIDDGVEVVHVYHGNRDYGVLFQ